MNIIPVIEDATTDLIQMLNTGGLPIEIQEEETFFVWYPDERPNEIITRTQLEEDYADSWMAIIKMCYKQV